MKKFLSVIVLSAMLVATLASCGGDDTTNTTVGATTEAPKTTTVAPPPPTDTEPPTPDKDVPLVEGAGLEELLAANTIIGSDATDIKVNMEALYTLGFGTWNAETENISQLFDGIKTYDDWYYDIDENGEKVLKDGALTPDMENGPNGGGPGKIGGSLNQNGYTGGYFFFGLTAPAKLSAYVLYTGNDNSKYPGRNPVEWTLYATNDATVFEEQSAEGATFDETKWTALDYVYDGSVLEANFAPNGYTIDADKQGEYQYYVWYLNYTTDNVFQACELDLLIAK